VVPSELGPDSYPEFEALKAQAVAARSYTLRNLGGFADEGYDLCGTPKCQVYGGVGAEHPLSDRAVAETAGEVLLWDGEPIDALYSATCGGHTEDVEVVFPLKRAPYLRGVSCLEAGVATLAAPAGSAGWPHAVLARAIPDLSAKIDGAADLEHALDRLAAAAGLATAPDRLASLDRAELRRFLASRFDLALDPRLFASPEEVAAAAHPGAWSAADRELAAWLAQVAGADDGRSGRIDLAGAEPLLLRLAQRLGLLERRRAIFDALRAGDLLVREGLREEGLHVDRTTLAFRAAETPDGTPRAATLALGAGDPVELWLARGHLAALVQELPAAAPAFDRPHARATWTRFRSDAEIADLVRLRFPGFDFAGLDVVARGPSGRVSRIRLRGRDESSVEVAGLAVRWTLDLPDTLFTVRRLAQRGRNGWQFSGRGWGHGVGLCQYGAWGMARRGLDYRAILAHYYSGATLKRLAGPAER
jgi:stage II sporulation protein D